jgi:hypothetical protein
MRDDFHKVVIERPRWGSSNPSRKTGWSVGRARYDPENEYALPKRESMSWRRFGDKAFSDHLAPLQRFLDKQVGRPWRTIEGEIRKALDTRTIIGRHLWDHAKHMVEIEVRMSPDGRPFSLRGYPISRLYVHPRSGLLLRPKPWICDEARARKRRLEQAKEIVLDARTRAEKIGDLWYLFIKEGRVEEVVEIRKGPSGKQARVASARDVVRKKQANSDEIRRIRQALEVRERQTP